ncbi:YdcF family protein [Halobacillus sp. SY10]|uniref:YdcF family protein n=1 Tax=Halobacillus sp. SY10 TaxID=3381356 RepID=UPI0038792295
MKRFIQIILFLMLGYALYTGYSVWTYGDEKASEADAAIVLGAAQWNGKPSPVFEGRLKQGIELYKEEQVEYLILTGGKSEQAASSEAEVGKDYAMDHGVKEEDILFEDRSLITEDNLSNAKEVSHEKGIRSFLIVSDQFHLKRAVAMAEKLDMEVEGVPTEYSAYKSMETKVPFFLREWGYWMGQPVTKLIML